MKPNVINIGKKAASLILLCVGLFFLETGVRNALVTYYVLSTATALLNLSAVAFQNNSLITTAAGIIVIALASFVWDFKKNSKLFGIFLCVAASNFMVQSIDTLLNPLFTDMSPFNSIFPSSVLIGFISGAVCFFVMGILIIRRTKRKPDDRTALSHA